MQTIGKPYISAILFLVIISILGSSYVNASSNRTAILRKKAQGYYWGRGVTQDYARALQLYETAAALGDPQASNIAGGMYYTGKGTITNPYKAFMYLDYAADHGKTTPDASIALASFYLTGEIVPQNYTKAVQLYLDAADSGNPRAQLELGFLYYIGRGVAQDFSKAREWFKKAALNNYNMAQYNLGIMWYTGNNGLNKSSLIEAYAWTNIAASNFYQDAYVLREYLKSALTQDELKRAQQKSKDLYDQIKKNMMSTSARP